LLLGDLLCRDRQDTGSGQHKKPLAERWNGSEWAILPTPSPVEAKGDVTLEAVSCSAAYQCAAVGQYSPQPSPNELRTLAENLNGANWTLQTAPAQALKFGGYTGVSCSSAIACTAVGTARAEELRANLGEVSLAARYE
jgi:hypothetical protein